MIDAKKIYHVDNLNVVTLSETFQKASMRSSTKSESNCNNNNDNLNNNLDEADKRSADDVIDIAESECSSKLLNQSGNGKSELTQRAEHADNDKSAKVNVYEQVRKGN
jgi:hypothetical protein